MAKRPRMYEGQELPKNVTVRPDGLLQATYYKGKDRKFLYSRDLDTLLYRLQLVSNSKVMTKIPTVDELFELYMALHKSNTIKATTAASYYSRYYNHVSPLHGHKNCLDIVKSDIYDLIDYWDYTMVSITQQRRILYDLRSAYTFGQNLFGFKENPCANVFITQKKEEYNPDEIDEDEGGHRFIEKDERDKLLSLLKDTLYEVPVKIALYSGMRAGEICALKKSDIDFKNKLIKVRHTLSKVFYEETGEYEYNLTSPKTRASIRTIDLHPVLAELLQDAPTHEFNVLIGECESDLHFETVTDFLFISASSKLMIPTYLDKGIAHALKSSYKNACRVAMLKKTELPTKPEMITMHDLRATFATLIFKNVSDIKEVQNILGHASPETTMKFYLKAQRDRKHDIIHSLEI